MRTPNWTILLALLSISISSSKGYVNVTSTPPGWTSPYSIFRSITPGSWSYIFDLNLAGNFSGTSFLLTFDAQFFGVSYASVLLSSNTPYQDASAYQVIEKKITETKRSRKSEGRKESYQI